MLANYFPVMLQPLFITIRGRMFLSKIAMFRMAVFFLSVTIFGLFAADVPTDCLVSLRGVTYSVLSGVPALCCCGTTTAGAVCGAATGS